MPGVASKGTYRRCCSYSVVCAPSACQRTWKDGKINRFLYYRVYTSCEARLRDGASYGVWRLSNVSSVSHTRAQPLFTANTIINWTLSSDQGAFWVCSSPDP